MKKDKFAFIVHLMKRQDVLEFYPWLKLIPNIARASYLKDLAFKLPNNKFLELRANTSRTEKFVSGMGILCPIFPEQFISIKEEIVLEKIRKACILAQRQGAGIIGLGGFTSIVGNEGEFLAGKLDAGITSGNTYTAYLALEGIFKAALIMDIDLSRAIAAVIGATGDIGSICSRVLARKVKQINLVARNEPRLEEFAGGIRQLNGTSVNTTKYIADAVKNADIILTATSSITTLIEPKELKPGCVVCDVSLPPNIAREIYSIRQDVLVFEGGKAWIPNTEKIKNRFWQEYFSDGIIFGCLAETMLLALDGYFKDFSVGRGNITEEKLAVIGEMSKKHGFTLAPFKCGTKILDDVEIKLIRQKALELAKK